MPSNIFTLNKKDFINGLVVAVLGAVCGVLYGVLQQPGFNVISADWGSILSQMLQVAVSSFLGYIAKNFMSDENGKVLGKI